MHSKLRRMLTTTAGRALTGIESPDPEFNGRLRELAELLCRHAPVDGIHPTSLAGVSAIRVSRPSDEALHALHRPALCVIAQGAKRVLLQEEVYAYDASRFLVCSVDLPITAQVVEATTQAPYLCFLLDFDPSDISALLLARTPLPAVRAGSTRGLYLSRSSAPMLDAVVRLMRLADAPDDANLLAPLATQEILVRLLRSEEGHRLAHIARSGSQAHRIAKAIEWLKTHYAEPLRIEELAQRAHMSPSSLHHHFRTVTSMSPLQYQKQLRLQEARRLMLGEVPDAASAGHRVGYESPSQFSREYARLFGAPPARDMQRLRQTMSAATTATA